MKIIKKIYYKYKVGGLLSLLKEIKSRYSKKTLWWSKLGMISKFLAQHLDTAYPHIFVVSLPRSGSSWVGNTLARANNTMYLREPITQSYCESRDYVSTEVVFDPSFNTPEVYKHAAEDAFLSLPRFKSNIVVNPKQWSLFGRKHKHLIIKEVNPLAISWLLKFYSPRIIFIIRHPAAIALSYKKLNWGTFEDLKNWEERGEYVAKALRSALDVLKTYPDHQIIQYEALCSNPVDSFHDLYKFAGLQWDNEINDFILKSTSYGDTAKDFSTQRNSKNMIEGWRNRITNEELQSIRNGYSKYNLPWYISNSDW